MRWVKLYILVVVLAVGVPLPAWAKGGGGFYWPGLFSACGFMHVRLPSLAEGDREPPPEVRAAENPPPGL